MNTLPNLFVAKLLAVAAINMGKTKDILNAIVSTRPIDRTDAAHTAKRLQAVAVTPEMCTAQDGTFTERMYQAYSASEDFQRALTCAPAIVLAHAGRVPDAVLQEARETIEELEFSMTFADFIRAMSRLVKFLADADDLTFAEVISILITGLPATV